MREHGDVEISFIALFCMGFNAKCEIPTGFMKKRMAF